ncbi:MAG: amidohydrolase family protein, partial [Clostridia bacterium]|nr:amidohydrolase family protein [Clostridia bacterium]
PVVAAHLGGLCDKENTLKYLAGKDIYLDTAYTYAAQPPASVKEIISAHGAGRILLASDSPWNDPADCIALVKLLGFSEEDEKKILGENARRLLGL